MNLINKFKLKEKFEPESIVNDGKILKKSDWLKLISSSKPEEIVEISPYQNNWGISYFEAEAYFYLYLKIRDSLEKKSTLEVLGIDFNFSRVKTLEEMLKLTEEFYLTNIDSHETWKEEYEKFKNKRFNNFESLILFFKSQSWDLWTVTNFFEDLFFEDLKISNVPKAEGHGPDWNKIQQGNNYRTGLICAMLVDYGIIRDITIFNDFCS